MCRVQSMAAILLGAVLPWMTGCSKQEHLARGEEKPLEDAVTFYFGTLDERFATLKPGAMESLVTEASVAESDGLEVQLESVTIKPDLVSWEAAQGTSKTRYTALGYTIDVHYKVRVPASAAVGDHRVTLSLPGLSRASRDLLASPRMSPEADVDEGAQVAGLGNLLLRTIHVHAARSGRWWAQHRVLVWVGGGLGLLLWGAFLFQWLGPWLRPDHVIEVAGGHSASTSGSVTEKRPLAEKDLKAPPNAFSETAKGRRLSGRRAPFELRLRAVSAEHAVKRITRTHDSGRVEISYQGVTKHSVRIFAEPPGDTPRCAYVFATKAGSVRVRVT